MMNDIELRLECLRIADKKYPGADEAYVIAAAETLYRYVMNGQAPTEVKKAA